MALALSHLLSLLLVLLLPYSTIAQTSRNQSLGSSLTAQEKDSYWASPSGDFAFGFQQIGKGGYLLAIWFNKIPEKTIVWSANGDNLVPTGSKVELTKEGLFVLSDPTGKEIWKPPLDRLGVAYAAMLDTGNFVLASQDTVHLWQSFDHPTDTMLPTQKMRLGSKLVARYLEMNYSNGRFQFTLKSDGNLVLQTRAYPMDHPYVDYWPRPEEYVGSGFQVVFNKSGSINFIARNGSIVKTISSSPGSTQDFYQRALMEYDGVLRHYVYPKSSSGSWPMTWSSLSSFIPSNICNFVAIELGGGACGYNSYCRQGDDLRPKCLCPDGYSFIDPDDVLKGCKQNFLSQSCDEAFPESDLFYFKSMLNTDWPGWTDYEYLSGQTEDFSVFMNLLFMLAAFFPIFRFKYWKPKALLPYPIMPGMNLRSYTYEELTEATNGFKEELGKDRKLNLLVENDEEAIDDMKRVKKYVMIAIWCIQEDPSLRPTMKKVVQMMEGAVEVSVPPGPSSFISSI
ncbi:g-type lectin s-receptor-like serine/threonine-protein kinase lecrk2 [Quercus suber]|uniref:G-type lectin s-receptor-like serine/threonine-protein kinase lecrk2 n=1 Tax=Quercus suber TaxID=58331 RepID=A0AAW0KYT3_QUESU